WQMRRDRPEADPAPLEERAQFVDQCVDLVVSRSGRFLHEAFDDRNHLDGNIRIELADRRRSADRMRAGFRRDVALGKWELSGQAEIQDAAQAVLVAGARLVRGIMK